MNMTVIVEISFAAAHKLPQVAPDHKCYRLHGHNFKVELHVTGHVDPHMGWVEDFGVIRNAFEPLRLQLDHQYLNDIEGLENPTSENIAMWIFHRLETSIPQLSAVCVHETCTSRCIYKKY